MVVNGYKQRFIAGSSKCSTKKLSKLLTAILTKIKEGLHKYCETIYSRSGVNQMWILKNSKVLFDNINTFYMSLISETSYVYILSLILSEITIYQIYEITLYCFN